MQEIKKHLNSAFSHLVSAKLSSYWWDFSVSEAYLLRVAGEHIRLLLELLDERKSDGNSALQKES